MSDPLYQETIIEEYKHPKNKGKIEDADLVLGGKNASCGDDVTIYLQFKDADQSKPIIQLKWEGKGCAVSQAAMSVLSQIIIQKQLTIKQILKLSKKDLLENLGLETINPGREKCLMMGLESFINYFK